MIKAATLLTDREVIAELGTAVLRQSGYNDNILKQWRRRGIAWKERTKVRDIALAKGVGIPADFDRVKRAEEKPKRAKAKPAPKKRARTA